MRADRQEQYNALMQIGDDIATITMVITEARRHHNHNLIIDECEANLKLAMEFITKARIQLAKLYRPR